MLRETLPTAPGVYTGVRLDDLEKENPLTIQVQRAEDGTWWPHPYIFSGWRNSELELFSMSPRLELKLDVPEIRNPDDAERVEWFTAQFLEFLPGVNEKDAVKLARKFVLEDGR